MVLPVNLYEPFHWELDSMQEEDLHSVSFSLITEDSLLETDPSIMCFGFPPFLQDSISTGDSTIPRTDDYPSVLDSECSLDASTASPLPLSYTPMSSSSSTGCFHVPMIDFDSDVYSVLLELPCCEDVHTTIHENEPSFNHSCKEESRELVSPTSVSMLQSSQTALLRENGEVLSQTHHDTPFVWNKNSTVSSSEKTKRRKRHPSNKRTTLVPNTSRDASRTRGDVLGSSTSNITARDVLLGKGGTSFHHPGNKVYMEKIREARPKYATLRNRQAKTCFARKIVHEIIRGGGRFMIRATAGSDAWEVMNVDCARKKVSQALREKRS